MAWEHWCSHGGGNLKESGGWWSLEVHCGLILHIELRRLVPSGVPEASALRSLLSGGNMPMTARRSSQFSWSESVQVVNKKLQRQQREEGGQQGQREKWA